MIKKFILTILALNIASTFAYADQKLNLDMSIKTALENNYLVKAAQEKVYAAEGTFGVARSALLPQISASGSLTRQYQSPTTMRFTLGGVTQTVQAGIDEPSNISNYNISLLQTLFTFGKVLSSVDVADKNLQIAKQDLLSIEWDTYYLVTSTYYGVLKFKSMVKLAQQSIDLAKAHKKQIQAMFEQGISTRADILRNEVQLSQSNQGLIKARNGLEVAYCAFNTAIGRDVDSPVEIDETIPKINDISQILGDLTKSMFANNPDWIKFGYTKKISESNLFIATKDYLPMFSLSGSYGGTATDYRNNNLQYNTSSWNMVVAGSWDIFNGFKTSSNVKEATANLAVVEAQRENLRRQLSSNIKQEYLELISDKEQIDASKTSVALAKENLRLAELKYRTGMGTNLEVVDAQTAYIQSEYDLITTAYDYLVAKAKISKIIGKKLE